MAGQQVTERWSDRQFTPSVGASRSFDAPGYDTAPSAIAAAINNFGLRVGNPHPNDPNMQVTFGGVTAKNNGGPTTWIVTAAYAFMVTTIVGGDDPNPLNRPTRWRVTPGLKTILIDQDKWGNPITNSAGVPFDKQPRTIRVLHITAFKYFANYNINECLKYMNHISVTPIAIKSFGTVPGKCFKCNFIGPTQDIYSGQNTPVELQIDFEVAGPQVSGTNLDPGFALRLIDQGFSGNWNSSTEAGPGDFSVKSNDIATLGQYVLKTTPTLLDGGGMPLKEVGLRIGTGLLADTKAPGRTPTALALDPSSVLIRLTPNKKATALWFDVEDEVDFSPLLASL